MSEVSGNAFKLFAYLCDRADRSGECFPSLALIAADCGWAKPHACIYRAALVSAGWITLVGDKITLQIWQSRLQRRAKRGSKTGAREGRKQPQTVTKMVTPVITEMVTSPPPERYENGNESLPKPSRTVTKTVISLINNETNERNQERNHIAAKPTKKKEKSSDPRSKHTAIQALREITECYPDKVLYDELISILGEQPDRALLRRCCVEWVGRGFNKVNYLGWVGWYRDGIPDGFSRAGKPSGQSQPETLRPLYVPDEPIADDDPNYVTVKEALSGSYKRPSTSAK